MQVPTIEISRLKKFKKFKNQSFLLTHGAMDKFPATLLNRKTFQTHIMDQETGLRRIGQPPAVVGVGLSYTEYMLCRALAFI